MHGESFYFTPFEPRRDFQQCGILTWIDSDESVQPPVKLRNSKWCSDSSSTLIEYSTTGKGSDQTVRMCRLIWDPAGRTYHIVGNSMSRLIFISWVSSWFDILKKFFTKVNILTSLIRDQILHSRHSGVVVDCIDSWSLPPFSLLFRHILSRSPL